MACRSPADPDPTAALDRSDPSLSAALAAAAWIENQSIVDADGTWWPVDPAAAEPQAAPDLSLYHGVPGVVLFLAEIGRATGDGRARELARAGADTLLHHLDDAELDAGLYSGLAGIGTVLLELDRLDPDARYRDGAARVVARLAAEARPAGAGVEWNDSIDIISGASGTGLFLIEASRRLGESQALELATQAGRRLVELARREPSGWRWDMTPGFAREMPNFSHGTAGVAYFLATLADATGEGTFRDSAVAGARYLQSIADTTGDACLIYHHGPDGKDLYYLSWCHGPAGTARLFHRLSQLTGDPEWRQWVERSARAVAQSGIPEQRTPGFWNNISMCCGTAGVLDFFLDLEHTFGAAPYRPFTDRLVADLLERAAGTPGERSWLQAENRVQPELLQAQTGYMQGAAGAGMALLRASLAAHGTDIEGRLPDSPW